MTQYLVKCERVHVVWDSYQEYSLKWQEQINYGDGLHRKVAPSTWFPLNWTFFLHVDDNKTEMFSLLRNQVAKMEGVNPVYVTQGENVLVNQAD